MPKTAQIPDHVAWARHTPPETKRGLWWWIRTYLGISVSHQSVCADHTAPFDICWRQFRERPRVSLVHGPRGSGKSLGSAIDTHITSRFNPGHHTAILGGSLSQSGQIYQALKMVAEQGMEGDMIAELYKQECIYSNGSKIDVLPASAKSVHGPHPQTLKLDEVDEIDPDIRERAMGMPQTKGDQKLSIMMTSTWHNVGGPMANLMDRGRENGWPVDTYCVFEVMERCPEERSGPNLENCPACPIVRWCHSDRDDRRDGLPKAKRSRGHYTIDDLITKAGTTSEAVFEADYLCLRPRAAGVWFVNFMEDRGHVTQAADYYRGPFIVSIDPGVHCGAVLLQIQRNADGTPHHVNVFGEYYKEDLEAYETAIGIKDVARQLTGLDITSGETYIDPSSKDRTAVGPTLRGEYERVGCIGRNGLEQWYYESRKSKVDGLNFISALLKSADGVIRLTIHPRCRNLIRAFQTYKRASVGGQLMDWPEDPQHPAENMIDPLNGALKRNFPSGRTPPPKLFNVHASRIGV